MPGDWRRACHRKIAQHRAFDMLMLIEAALFPRLPEQQQRERLDYWHGFANTAPMQQTAPRDRTLGHFVPQTFEQFAGFLRRGGGRPAR